MLIIYLLCTTNYIALVVTVSFQLIVYTVIKITIRGTSTTVFLYEFAVKQPEKEHKLGVKIFLSKLGASRAGPVKSTEK